jgi:hypothetical protein
LAPGLEAELAELVESADSRNFSSTIFDHPCANGSDTFRVTPERGESCLTNPSPIADRNFAARSGSRSTTVSVR